jgi:hypothetical protein
MFFFPPASITLTVLKVQLTFQDDERKLFLYCPHHSESVVDHNSSSSSSSSSSNSFQSNSTAPRINCTVFSEAVGQKRIFFRSILLHLYSRSVLQLPNYKASGQIYLAHTERKSGNEEN